MTSIDSKFIVIDACHPNGADLRSHIAQLLYAADPETHHFEKIVAVHPEDDVTDWPEANWLDLITFQEKDGPDHSPAEKTVTKTQLRDMFQKHHDDILLTLNSAVPAHPHNHVILSDQFVSDTFDERPEESLFNRLRNRVTTTVTQNSFQQASSLIGFSSFATSHINKLEKPCYTLPMGIPPEHFTSNSEHPVINQLNTSNPFIWLTSLVDDEIIPVFKAIEAAKILNNYGAYIQLRILTPESHDGTVLTTTAEKAVADACKGLGYAQIATASDDSELLDHFREANGYIWNYQTDKNHRDLLFAMSNSLPILAPRSEMVKKHVGDRVRFFTFEDSDDLASNLERSMADIHYRILSSTRNHRKAMTYTWEKTASELFGLLNAHEVVSNQS